MHSLWWSLRAARTLNFIFVKVRAKNGIGWSASSDLIHFETLPIQKPRRPSGLVRRRGFFTDSIEVEWPIVDGTSSGSVVDVYEIQYSLGRDQGLSEKFNSFRSNQRWVTGLRVCDFYWKEKWSVFELWDRVRICSHGASFGNLLMCMASGVKWQSLVPC